MRKLITTVAAVLFTALCVLSATKASAEMAPGEHKNGGLGFHSSSAPIGVRWWFAGQKVGLDAGVGFSSVPSTDRGGADPDEKLKDWAIDVGVPFVMHSWNRFHLMFRPGLLYQSTDEVTSVTPFESDSETEFSVSAEIEGEVFLVDNVSVSASHGLRFNSVNPAGPGDSVSRFGTFGNNFTEVGFHVYFFGGSE